jgi:hypothetical protein
MCSSDRGDALKAVVMDFAAEAEDVCTAFDLFSLFFAG